MEAVTCIGHRVGGIAAVDLVAGEAGVVAEIFLMVAAIGASAVGEAEPRHADAVASCEALHLSAPGVDAPDDLMAEHQRQLRLREAQSGPGQAPSLAWSWASVLINSVMPGLDPGIHAVTLERTEAPVEWIAGSSPAMTKLGLVPDEGPALQAWTAGRHCSDRLRVALIGPRGLGQRGPDQAPLGHHGRLRPERLEGELPEPHRTWRTVLEQAQGIALVGFASHGVAPPAERGAVGRLLMGVEQARIARPADQLSRRVSRAQLGKAGVEPAKLDVGIERGHQHLGGDADALQITGLEDQGLCRARRCRAQNHCQLARLADTAFDAGDELRQNLEMPIEFGVLQIPRTSRTNHNAHVPPALWMLTVKG